MIRKVLSPQTIEQELLDLKVRLRDLQSKYTDEHPDIVALKEKIAKAEALKKQNESEMAETQKEPQAANGVDPASMEQVQHGSPSSMMQVESQLKANQLEIANDDRREKDLDAEISAYQGRLNLTPETEQELINISRGYDESKSNYDSLLQKQMQSQLATSLEQRQQGEQFRIIDPPSLPEKPSAPNRLMFSLGGLFAGALLGLGPGFRSGPAGRTRSTGKRSGGDCSRARARGYSPLAHAKRKWFGRIALVDGTGCSHGARRVDCAWQPLRILQRIRMNSVPGFVLLEQTTGIVLISRPCRLSPVSVPSFSRAAVTIHSCHDCGVYW